MEANFVSVVWRRKWTILTAIVAALIVVYVGGRSATPVYEATAVLRVAIYASASQSPTLYNYNDELMNTFVKVATSTSIKDELANRLQTDQLPEIQVKSVASTELVTVTAMDADSRFAVQTANTLADLLVEQGRLLYAGNTVDAKNVLAGQLEQSKIELDAMRKEYEKLIAQPSTTEDKIAVTGQLLQEKQRTYETFLRQYEQAIYREALESGMVTLVERATSSPVTSPQDQILNYIFALFAGLAVGVGAALLLERLDTRIYATSEIETIINKPSIAKLPKTGRNHLYIARNGHSPLADTVRNLAATLQLADNRQYQKIILLTGAEPSQGATTTTANLGSALAEQGRKVLLVDCNLRDPNLHKLLNLPNDKGLTDVLSGKLDVADAIQPGTGIQPALLSTGPVNLTDSLAASSAGIESLIKTIRQKFDYILIDAPAIPWADLTAVIPAADGLVLVVRRSHVKRESVRAAHEFLSRHHNKFMGLIVNESETHGVYAL
jgi:capsular exopolysaccharide synthesis family protein